MSKAKPPRSDDSLRLSLSDDNTVDHWSTIQKWTNRLSKTTNHLDDLAHALQSLHLAAKDKETLKEILTSLAKLNKIQAQKKTKADDSKAAQEPIQSGNSLMDIFNSPAMRDIVQTVFKQRKRHW
ncbi:hypothetical protein SAMN06265361_102522 [Laceyella tengchongensis]|jgi:hypothetical protein|uniref:Uncharacterized protein n=1 Tax=Laceyella tengchongensis TaxID=574699 RepID=A0AA46AER6_9BACL|nr:hypothetical protein [Laceyella tengchongensis]SMP13964.1 hypothetical protein SAMN06265361_102522 [Laceyella tengchongensis]